MRQLETATNTNNLNAENHALEFAALQSHTAFSFKQPMLVIMDLIP